MQKVYSILILLSTFVVVNSYQALNLYTTGGWKFYAFLAAAIIFLTMLILVVKANLFTHSEAK